MTGLLSEPEGFTGPQYTAAPASIRKDDANSGSLSRLTLPELARMAQASPLAGLPAPDTWVYFVQAGTDGPVKIGTSQTPFKRLRSLQTGHPDRLRLLGVMPGSKDLERLLHEEFVEYAIQGEWFRPTPELVAVAEAFGDRIDLLEVVLSGCGAGAPQELILEARAVKNAVMADEGITPWEGMGQ